MVTDIEKLIEELKDTGFDHKFLMEIISEDLEPDHENGSEEGQAS